MNNQALTCAIATVPHGMWAVGVSGGADSVALLRLLSAREDLRLVVAHLNHQSRGEESDRDLEFVRLLCRELHVGRYLALREEIEKPDAEYPNNPSAKYRQLRFELFRTVVEKEKLDGVILAHHADDQAETVLQRLLRGSGYSALAGIAPRATVGRLTVVRPLLELRRESLRAWMRCNEYPWREDASNESDAFQRNRLRTLLLGRDDLFDALIALRLACAQLHAWVTENSPKLSDEFAVDLLADAPVILARHAASNWLEAHGSPVQSLDRAVVERLIVMCTDAATPARQAFPGNVSVSRRRGTIAAQRGAS